MILALDPGLAACGVALVDLDSKRLVSANYLRNPLRAVDVLEDARSMARFVALWASSECRTLAGGRPVSLLVAEWMKVYQAGRAKAGADANDLLPLAAVTGAVASETNALACKAVVARDWKGTLSDNERGEYLVELRVRDRLDAKELEAVVAGLPTAASLRHNTWDAVGIGLWAVGRGLTGAGRRRVFAP